MSTAAWVVQQLDHGKGIAAVPLHPDRQGLHASLDEKAVEGTGNGAGGILEKPQTLSDALVVRGCESSHDVRVAAEVLRCRVHHDVSPEPEGLLNPRRGERIVNDHERTMAVGDGRHHGDVDDVEQRVRRRFDPHHARLGGHDVFQSGEISGVDDEAGPMMNLGCEAIGAAVTVGLHDETIPGAQEPHHGVLCCQSAGEPEPEGRSLEQGQMRLETGPGRVARPRVLVAAVVADGILLEGRGQVKRRVDRPGRRVRTSPAMHRTRLESEPVEIQRAAHRRLTVPSSPGWRGRPNE